MSSDAGSELSGQADGRQDVLTTGLLAQLERRLRHLADDLAEAPPLEVLARVHALQQILAPVQEDAVRRALAEGATWSQVGSAAGVRRQSAHDRWSQLDPRRQEPSAPDPEGGRVVGQRAAKKELITLRLPLLPGLPGVSVEVERRAVR